jgi:site-specific DNA-methyltransferase (adenine-specific)
MIELLNMDCMEYMQGLPDKAFDLAIVDPPYGIDICKQSQGKGGKRTGATPRNYKKGNWDSSAPNSEYFAELFRVSNDQIVWGANYYPQYLKSSPGWILWDKGQRLDQADGELAYSSIKKPLRVFTLNRVALLIESTIHPCQKPIKLYQWLLENYAKPGQKILDTHLGSGSSAIAAHYFGVDFVGTELDKDYYDAACKRFELATAQTTLFDFDGA